MNAERLNAVLSAVRGEYTRFNLGGTLDALTNGLQGLTNQPADSAAQ
jgi:hypothetical protein